MPHPTRIEPHITFTLRANAYVKGQWMHTQQIEHTNVRVWRIKAGMSARAKCALRRCFALMMTQIV